MCEEIPRRPRGARPADEEQIKESRVEVVLPADLRRQLRIRAIEEGISMRALCKRAILRELEATRA